MSTRYSPFSAKTRAFAAVAAVVITFTLFLAVATGLTGDDVSQLRAAAESPRPESAEARQPLRASAAP
jgi:hypothetical protein